MATVASGEAIERCRKALMAGEAPFPELIAREGWYCDLRPLRYLSHFVTPKSSPIRFTARFFVRPFPVGGDEDSRARGVRARLSGSVRGAGRPVGRPPRRPPQVPGDRRSHRRALEQLRLEAKS